MKLLVFAHTPPPHHGQSYMVKLMLDGFGGDARQASVAGAQNDFGIECYHVNARFSKALEDVGSFQGSKILLIFCYCLQAIWIRFRYGVENFYYVPAPGKKVALYRDWLVMFLCRPFFKRVILHWHAAGLAKWLETCAPMSTRSLTYRLFRPVNLSLVLSRFNVADAEKLLSHQVCAVNNGIPDPCPDYEPSLRPQQQARLAARQKVMQGTRLTAEEYQAAGGDPEIVKVLFLAHCMKEKGLFDALEGVALANARLGETHSPLRFKLVVAGEFINSQDRVEFDQRVAALASGARPTEVDYLGFVSGAGKRQAFANSDVFCFPTFYPAESFGLVVVEAMAFGLPVVTTQWRSIPEILPANYPGLVAWCAPEQIADVLIARLSEGDGLALRAHFLEHFTVEQHLKALAQALHRLEPKP